MSCIHYKFKSSLDYNSVTFDGLHLSLGDLKKAISTQKRLKQGEFELEIINAQTGDVYKKSDELIAKNTSVIVSRVPVTKTNTTSTQRSWEAFKQECAKVKQQERDKMLELEMQKKAAEAITVPSSEMDKIKAVIDQSTKGFEPSSFQGRNPHAIPHDHYVCKRCGNKGHYILNCPNIKQEDRVIEPRVKRTTGIPSTMLTIVDDPLHPGALLTHHGQFAVPTVDVEGYRDSKKDLPPFSGEKSQPEVEKKIIPKELLCHICEDLCVDAAIAPCCGTSFCDECLREELLESEDHQCPSCHETNVSPDRIVANRSMRIAVTNFLNDTGYSKVKRRRSSSTSGEAGSIFAHTTRPPSPPPPPPQPNAASPPSQVSQHSGVSQARAEAISSLVDSVPSSSIATTLGTDTSGYPGPSPRDTYQPRSYRGGHNSYKPWHHQEPVYDRPPISWNGGPPLTSLQQPPTFVSATPPAPVMAAAAAVASRAIQALVGQRLPLPHLMPPNFPGLRGFPPMAPRPMGLGRYPAASPPKRKAVDVFDSFADFTKKRSRTPELRSRSRSRSGSRPRRSSHSSYSPAKKGSRGRSPRRSSLSRSRSPSRTGSFKRSRSRGRSPKRSRSKTPPRRRRTGSAESRGLSELRSISPESAKRSKSRSRSPRPLLRSRSRSRSYKRSYRSRSRSWSKSKKVQSRSYSPLSPKPLRRSPDRSPRRSPRRSPYRSPGRSPLYSPVRSRSRRSFTPRRRSRSFSPRRKSPARSKSRSPFNKRRPTYSRSKSPVHTRKRSPSPYNKARRSPSPYSKAGGYSKKKSPSPYQYRGGYRERDSKYPREDRGSGPSARPRLSPPRRPSGPGNAPPPPAHPNAAANLPPVQLLPNMALPPPEEYFKHNPAGYEEFLRTFYAQVGNQGTPWGGAPQGGHPPPSHPPPGPHFGNSYPPAGPLNGPPVHPHSGFPQDRRPPPWNSGGPPPLRPRSVSPIGRMAPPSPKYGDRYRRDRDTTRPGLDGRGIGRDKDRRFDDHRFGGDRNTRRGADSRDDDHRQEDRRWRGDFKDKRPEEGKDRKVIHSEIRDKRGPREGEKRGRDGDKTRNVDKSKDGQKSKERLSTEKRKSPQNASKQQEKSRKGEDRRKKEEKENVESKPKSDASDKASEVKKAEAIDINGDSALAGHGKPLDDLAQAKKDDMPDGTNNSRQPSQDNGEKEKKAPGKKKVGAAGKKLKTKGGNAVDGEKKEKKIKKKKLTFGASEADNKGLKKKKLKRVVDYKSENTGTSEDAVDLEKGILAEPSPVKRAKFEAMEDGDLAAEKMEFAEDVDPSKNVPMPNDCLETPERAMPVGEEKEVSWPSSPDKPKSGLMTELPELSKWERDDDFDLPVVEKAEEKHKEKPSLPRSVVDKAEMFLVGKPMKNSVVAAPVPSIDTIPEAADKQKDVQDKPRPMADKEKYGREAAPLRPKERDASDRHSRGGSDRRRMSQDERREEVCDSRRKDPKDYRVKSPIHPGRDYNRSGGNNNSNKDYRSKSPGYNNRPKSPNFHKDLRAKSPVHGKDYRSKSPIHNKDYRSKSPIHNKDYRSKSPIHNKDYRSKSPIHNKDYRSKSPIHNKDYRSKSPIHNKDYRSKSPIHNKDYRSKSPIHNKDYRSKSPAHPKDYKSKSPSDQRSRKVSIDSKKDHREKRDYDIKITVKGDRESKKGGGDQERPTKKGGGDQERPTKKGGGDQAHKYQDRGDLSDEDERSVVRSHSLERELKTKTKGQKAQREEGAKSHDKRKNEKDASSTWPKSKRSKKGKPVSEDKDSGTPAGSGTTTTTTCKKESQARGGKEDSGPHRSPRDLRHKIEEKTKGQTKSQNASTHHQRKLSVMDEAEFVPDYEDTLGHEGAGAGGGEDKGRPSVSPSWPDPKEGGGGKGKGESSEKSSEEEEGGGSEEVKEGKKHKKSKKKHKHKDKKEKKEKHKQKKKKKHKKNKEEED